MKKIALACSLLAAAGLSTASVAGNFYIGPSLFYQYLSSSTSHYTDLHPRGSLGYGGTYDKYYFAGEIWAIPATLTLSNSVNTGGVSAKTTRTLGFSFLPGMMITSDSFAYLRLGILTSKFSAPNSYKTGGELGVGVQQTLSGPWSLRAEYIYTAYKSTAGLGSVKSNALGAGFTYTFC